ncbi:MAG: TetR family transcriptional regulator [Alphaproteobacteria bacterium]|nr:TetR family transcriptional regulator [Alphaproteobacteria bacterium]
MEEAFRAGMAKMTKPEKAWIRDREGKEQAILKAAMTVLAERGFSKFGVNAVAKGAGCDKQLIYRYFGGLEGLADKIGEELADWIGREVSPDTRTDSYAETVADLLGKFSEALLANDLVRQIVIWELAESTPITVRLSAARSRALSDWISRTLKTAPSPSPRVDAPAINAILIAGVQHLVLAERSSGSFAGLDLDEAGRRRVRAAIRALCRSAYGEGEI